MEYKRREILRHIPTFWLSRRLHHSHIGEKQSVRALHMTYSRQTTGQEILIYIIVTGLVDEYWRIHGEIFVYHRFDRSTLLSRYEQLEYLSFYITSVGRCNLRTALST